MSLDDKLRKIFADDITDGEIKAIKQAIVDERYCYHNELYKGQDVDVMMFGQEWFERFEKELQDVGINLNAPRDSNWWAGGVMIAARKAAGIE